jgi:hypothetical protein
MLSSILRVMVEPDATGTLASDDIQIHWFTLKTNSGKALVGEEHLDALPKKI